jgi:hypothetical protein
MVSSRQLQRIRRLGALSLFSFLTCAMLGVFNDQFAFAIGWLEGDAGKTATLIALGLAAISAVWRVTAFAATTALRPHRARMRGVPGR